LEDHGIYKSVRLKMKTKSTALNVRKKRKPAGVSVAKRRFLAALAIAVILGLVKTIPTVGSGVRSGTDVKQPAVALPTPTQSSDHGGVNVGNGSTTGPIVTGDGVTFETSPTDQQRLETDKRKLRDPLINADIDGGGAGAEQNARDAIRDLDMYKSARSAQDGYWIRSVAHYVLTMCLARRLQLGIVSQAERQSTQREMQESFRNGIISAKAAQNVVTEVQLRLTYTSWLTFCQKHAEAEEQFGNISHAMSQLSELAMRRYFENLKPVEYRAFTNTTGRELVNQFKDSVEGDVWLLKSDRYTAATLSQDAEARKHSMINARLAVGKSVYFATRSGLYKKASYALRKQSQILAMDESSTQTDLLKAIDQARSSKAKLKQATTQMSMVPGVDANFQYSWNEEALCVSSEACARLRLATGAYVKSRRDRTINAKEQCKLTIALINDAFTRTQSDASPAIKKTLSDCLALANSTMKPSS
jgi:hypothetical protein